MISIFPDLDFTDGVACGPKDNSAVILGFEIAIEFGGIVAECQRYEDWLERFEFAFNFQVSKCFGPAIKGDCGPVGDQLSRGSLIVWRIEFRFERKPSLGINQGASIQK